MPYTTTIFEFRLEMQMDLSRNRFGSESLPHKHHYGDPMGKKENRKGEGYNFVASFHRFEDPGLKITSYIKCVQVSFLIDTRIDRNPRLVLYLIADGGHPSIFSCSRENRHVSINIFKSFVSIPQKKN